MSFLIVTLQLLNKMWKYVYYMLDIFWVKFNNYFLNTVTYCNFDAIHVTNSCTHMNKVIKNKIKIL